MDYDASLDRAMAELPDFTEQTDRLDVPDAAAQRDGAFTRFTNLGAVADALARDPEHVHSFVQRELGTRGEFQGDRARYGGEFSGEDLDAAVSAYTVQFVTCSECGLPDTHLESQSGTRMLRCDACGAFRPVDQGATATSSTQQRDAVEEGVTYEVEIVGTGRKGDGVAERGNYTIFVSGAREGETVDAYVESVSGNLAFARKA